MNNKKDEFTNFIHGKEPFSRSNPIGHITGSCWILNRSLTSVLLTHHKKLMIWIPTGGHSEGETDPYNIALREGEEETGLKLKSMGTTPFFMDIHDIPKYNGIPNHKHYDYTYLFIPEGSEDYIISEESLNLKWIPLDEIEKYSQEKNVLLMRDKSLNLIKNGNITILK